MTLEVVGVVPIDAQVEPNIGLPEQEPGRLRRFGHALIASAVTHIGGIPMTEENVDVFYGQNVRIINDGIKNTIDDWQESSIGKKVWKPIRGSLSWVNLIAGETIALAVQGGFQAGG